ncbi:MAG: formate dehydrogenase subunit alpha, partial [Dehalococcoidia bacterium]
AARGAGIAIPALCHDPRYRPVGVCRLCAVDVGERTLAAACVRRAEQGMTVDTRSPKVEQQRAVLVELLMSDQPDIDPKQRTTGDNELLDMADLYGVARPTRFVRQDGRPDDVSNPVIAVDHQACIMCDRCVRACDDVQSNEVIGRTGKGFGARIAFDLDDPMGESSCVTCGECVAACPTGAITNKQISLPIRPRSQLKQVDSVCPYCGVGCALTYHVDPEEGVIVFVDGRDQPGNKSRLCVKGRYGWDYALSDQRLTVPLIRRDGAYPKGPISDDVRGESDGTRRGRGGEPGGRLVDYSQVLPHFREATWDEALDLAARRLRQIKEEHGSGALAGFGSAKCSNEEAYLFQKFVRAGFGTNNVDHCTRLCHASSVAALLEGIGSGAVTTTYGDVVNADVAIVVGSNAAANHPVAASFFKQARKQGTTLIVVDPREGSVADHADIYCRIRPGTDVAFFNGVMNVVVSEGLVDEKFVAERTSNFEALRETLLKYPPEFAARICGVDADTIRRVGRTWGSADAGIVFWGMGISQHTTGTDNARCLIAMCAITGNVGHEGSGLHPLRGQNNVQGASDAGLIPMVYPDYQSVADADVRARFEAAWGRPLDPEAGLTVTEIIAAAREGTIKGMYMVGENPFLSDPNVNKVREGLAALDFLVVQDIFLTETAEFADVILPATSALEKSGTYTNTDRRVQVGRPAMRPPGRARPDLEIICDLATRFGLPMEYESAEAVFKEMVPLMPAYSGLSHQAVDGPGKLYPLDDEHPEGRAVLFGDAFATDDGRARLVATEWLPADELPDDEYPLILTTGRILQHWHTGSMTRRSFALDSIAPEAEVSIHPADADRLGVEDGAFVRVSSRRGEIRIRARLTDREGEGACFIPFHFREAAANLLTNDALDPVGKIPEFKFCAVRIEPE